jgi:hypothetical protein
VIIKKFWGPTEILLLNAIDKEFQRRADILFGKDVTYFFHKDDESEESKVAKETKEEKEYYLIKTRYIASANVPAAKSNRESPRLKKQFNSNNLTILYKLINSPTCVNLIDYF